MSRKSVKSAHSTRNRYSSQWTLTKCQASTPARTLTSDWRTVGSQHGITVTESDSYSASLSQDTGMPWHPQLLGLFLAGICQSGAWLQARHLRWLQQEAVWGQWGCGAAELGTEMSTPASREGSEGHHGQMPSALMLSVNCWATGCLLP